MNKKIYLIFFLASLLILFISCKNSAVIQSVKEDELFSLSYGYFDDELNMFDLTKVGKINTSMTMRDGFFYISNGEAKKIMELNSYGDLLTLYYNENNTEQTAPQKINNDKINRKLLSYPLIDTGVIAVDEKKRTYIVSTMPQERQEADETGSILYSQIILRFSRDGSAEDYLGQQGIGGTPFPFIKNIYTTTNNELVVVCVTQEGPHVYWFSESGSLMYQIPISKTASPPMPDSKNVTNTIAIMQDVIPDYSSRKLFVKIDYYQPKIDEDSKTESGIDFKKTYIFPISVEDGMYGNPISIPPYEQTISADYSKLVFSLPYDFLGVSNSGWLFFIISSENGFDVQMVQPANQKIIKRHFNVNHDNVLYYSLSLSETGIISGLFAGKDKAKVVWWRTDSLTATILKS